MGEILDSRKPNLLTFISIILTILFILATISQAAWAQTAGSAAAEDEWSQPINLSKSGASDLPRLVADGTGQVHVLWLDQYAGVLATQGKDGNWPEPAVLELPFKKYFDSMKLSAGQTEYIYAAWIGDRDVLYLSRVANEAFTQAKAWSAPALAAASAVDYDLAVSNSGAAYLAYLRVDQTADLPAGIYVNRSAAGVTGSPRLLFASPYYRSLTADQINLSIATYENMVYVAWDDVVRERVYQTFSGDEGETWSEPREVDRRQSGDGNGIGPRLPIMSAQASQVLIVWQAGHQGVNCGLLYQYSTDKGQTWSAPAYLPAPLNQNCAQSLAFLVNAAGATYLMAETPAGVHLLAWQPLPQGASASAQGGWSPPVLQNNLNSITHPDTYRLISLGCRQVALSGDQLSVVSCEQGGEGDIWLMQRTLSAPPAWFPAPAKPALWSTPAALGTATEKLGYPLLLAESNRLHAFWTRLGDGFIYYAAWDGSRWTSPRSILSSPAQSPQALTAALLPGGVLSLTWSDPAAGELYYSLAPAAQAMDPERWLAPQEVPDSPNAASPQALALEDGRLAVAFTIPYNEKRGVYLLISKAPPQTGQFLEWAPPLLVFDAATAGWDSLSALRFVQAEPGDLHLLWTRYGLPPNVAPMGLYSAKSQCSAGLEACDDWSAPERIDDGAVLWSQFLAASGQLHRAWQKRVGEQVFLFHQVSLDNGASWSKAGRLGEVSPVQNFAYPAALVQDLTGQVNLLQLVKDTRPGAVTAQGSASLALERWIWQDSAWRMQESQVLPFVAEVDALSAAALAQRLAALYNGQPVVAQSNLAGSEQVDRQATPAPVNGIYITFRDFNQDQGNLTQTPAAQQTLSPQVAQAETQAAETPTPLVLPTPTFSKQPAPSSIVSRFGGRMSALILGAIPAIILVGFILLLAIRKARFGNR